MSELRVGIIGAGYWGPNLVRNFLLQKDAVVTMVADKQESRRKFITDRYPTIKTVDNDPELIGSPDVDAVVIATPVETHFPLAMAALEDSSPAKNNRRASSRILLKLRLMSLSPGDTAWRG